MSAETRDALELIRSRISVDRYDPAHTLSDDEVRELIDDTTHTPSSFNIQHWRFIAVRDRKHKEALTAAAYGQQQVRDAAVTFILLGDLRGIELLPEVLRRAVAEGVLPERRAAAWQRMAESIYADETLARDEVIRSCSLAAMTLMLAAEARGLCSGALVGFDPAKVKAMFAIPDRYLPVLLLTVGRPADRDEPRKTRLRVDEVLAFDRCGFDP